MSIQHCNKRRNDCLAHDLVPPSKRADAPTLDADTMALVLEFLDCPITLGRLLLMCNDRFARTLYMTIRHLQIRLHGTRNPEWLYSGFLARMPNLAVVSVLFHGIYRQKVSVLLKVPPRVKSLTISQNIGNFTSVFGIKNSGRHLVRLAITCNQKTFCSIPSNAFPNLVQLEMTLSEKLKRTIIRDVLQQHFGHVAILSLRTPRSVLDLCQMSKLLEFTVLDAQNVLSLPPNLVRYKNLSSLKAAQPELAKTRIPTLQTLELREHYIEALLSAGSLIETLFPNLESLICFGQPRLAIDRLHDLPLRLPKLRLVSANLLRNCQIWKYFDKLPGDRIVDIATVPVQQSMAQFISSPPSDQDVAIMPPLGYCRLDVTQLPLLKPITAASLHQLEIIGDLEMHDISTLRQNAAKFCNTCPLKNLKWLNLIDMGLFRKESHRGIFGSMPHLQGLSISFAFDSDVDNRSVLQSSLEFLDQVPRTVSSLTIRYCDRSCFDKSWVSPVTVAMQLEYPKLENILAKFLHVWHLALGFPVSINLLEQNNARVLKHANLKIASLVLICDHSTLDNVYYEQLRMCFGHDGLPNLELMDICIMSSKLPRYWHQLQLVTNVNANAIYSWKITTKSKSFGYESLIYFTKNPTAIN